MSDSVKRQLDNDEQRHTQNKQIKLIPTDLSPSKPHLQPQHEQQTQSLQNNNHFPSNANEVKPIPSDTTPVIYVDDSDSSRSASSSSSSSSGSSTSSSILGPLYRDEDFIIEQESATTNTPATTATTISSETNGSNDYSKNSKRPKIKRVDGKWILPPVTKEESSKARSFLKTQGMVAFLDEYLPDNPKGTDILFVIVLLGFHSFTFDDDIDDEKNLMKVVKMLQRAMNKVLFMRSRIPNINTIESVVEQIQKARKILVLTGAGVSTSLGIPDFRSSKGIYSKVQHLGLTDPQEVFDLQTFKEEPEIFYSIAHMILPPTGAFTPLHAFIKKLDDEGKLLRNYTQNIDDIEGTVGINPERVIQCHGSFAHATCQTCKWKVEGSKIFKYIRETELPICPFCHEERKRKFAKDEDYYPQSFGVMKPDIIFFGENLPESFHSSIKKDVQDCDLLLCIGTSLKVAPVSEIVNMVPETIPQFLINKDLVEHSEFDVSLLGYCDQVAVYLCNKLNWKLNHPDFEKISNSKFDVTAIDKDLGIFEIDEVKEVASNE